jgi:hypothetical protein
MDAKAAKKKPAAKVAKNSTDPVNWSVEKEASKTKAADKREKEKRSGGVEETKSKTVKVVKTAKEDWKATAAAGEFDAQVTQARAGVAWSEIIGAMPAEGTKQRKAWDALRVKIYKAAKKAKGAK